MKASWLPLLAVLCVIVTNCADKTEDELIIEPEVEIIPSKSSLRLGAISGSADSVTIQANVPWEVDNAATSWLSISPTEGPAGETTVHITALSDASVTRTESIIINPSGSDAPAASITVEQKVYAEEWKKNFGGSNDELCYNVIALNDGYLAVGSTMSIDGDVDNGAAAYAGRSNLYAVKIDENGNKIWGKSFGSSLSDAGVSAVKSSDGGYFIGGFTEKKDGDVTGNFHVGGYVEPDFWVIKLDAAGNKLWDKCFGGTGYDRVYSMAEGPNGGVVVAGESNSLDGDLNAIYDGRFFIISLDSNGQIIWKNEVGDSNSNSFPIITNTSDNGYILAGSSLDVQVIKLDKDGNELWMKVFAGNSDDTPWSIIEDDDENLIITGYSFSTDGDFSGNTSNGNTFVLKLNKSGDMQWIKFYGGNRLDQGRAIATADDGYFIAGVTRSTEGELTTAYGNYDYNILKIDKTGQKLWQKSYGGSAIDHVWGAVSTSDDGVLVAGYSNSSDHDITNPKGNADFFLMKIK